MSPYNDPHKRHMSHFDASGIFRVASNCTIRKHCSFARPGNAGFDCGVGADADQSASGAFKL